MIKKPLFIASHEIQMWSCYSIDSTVVL